MSKEEETRLAIYHDSHGAKAELEVAKNDNAVLRQQAEDLNRQLATVQQYNNLQMKPITNYNNSRCN